MLELQGVASGYGQVDVLTGVDLSVRTGEVMAVLGANGAGKSTLARTIGGTLRASAGSVRLGDRDVTRAPAHVRARAGIIHVPEGRHLFGSLTVGQNVDLGRRAIGRRTDDDGLDALLTGFPKVRAMWNRQAGLLSGGEQQMVALARAAAGRPRVLVLDEPSLGLSPLLVDEVFAMIGHLSQVMGCAIVLIEQMASRALRAADHGIVLAHGRVSARGTADELLTSAAVREAYLGVGTGAE